MSQMASDRQSRELALQWLKEAHNNPDADFRDDQWEAINTVVNRRKPLVVVQRTGWGKSVVYFLATRLIRMRGEGMSVIVSPLISLMRNQVDQAAKYGVKAVTINWSNRDQWEHIFQAIADGEVDSVLISPERLANEEFIHRVFSSSTNGSNNRIGLLVVDEAHCISVWGHDFRPDYCRLVEIIVSLPTTLRILGTTATATAKVVEDVRQCLSNDVEVLRGSLLRESLHLQNIPMLDQMARLGWLAKNVKSLPGSGIIYVLRKLDADQIADWLQAVGVDARAYYAGVSACGERIDEKEFIGRDEDYRAYLETLLIDNKIKALVATIALGMGFDKPDLGFVVHYQTPGSIVAYYQMVGRAGRATDKAYGILMTGCEDPDVQQHFWDSAFPSQEDIDDILEVLAECRDEGLTADDLEQFVNIRTRDISKTLRHLATRTPEPIIIQIPGTIRWTVNSQLWKGFQRDEDSIRRVTSQKEEEWNAMLQYVQCTDRCLMTKLRQMLDDSTLKPDGSDVCGKCCNCVGHPIVSTTSDPALTQKAKDHLRKSYKTFVCKTQVPKNFVFRSCCLPLDTVTNSNNEVIKQIPSNLQAAEGLVLCNWMDAGWGMKVHDDKRDKRFSDELVDALANAIKRWKPWDFRKKKYGWVTCVPSDYHPKLVPDFAYRLSKRLELPFQKVVVYLEHEAQKSRKNNYHRCDNMDGAFKIKEQVKLLRGPVIIVDDVIRSTWTLTVIAAQLRQAGCEKVFPVGLARIASED